MTPRQGIAKAVEEYGSVIALARAIGFTAPAIRRAQRLGRPTPEMCVCIEAVTEGRVKRIWLRPDIFGPQARLIDNSWNRGRREVA